MAIQTTFRVFLVQFQATRFEKLFHRRGAENDSAESQNRLAGFALGTARWKAATNHRLRKRECGIG